MKHTTIATPQLSITWAPTPPAAPALPSPAPVQPDRPDMLALYLASLQMRRLSPLTINGYRLELEALQRQAGMPLLDIDRATMHLAWAASCATDVEASTLERRLIAWRVCWRWASETEPPLPLADARPYRGIIVPKGEKRVRPYLTDEQARQLAANFTEGPYLRTQDVVIAALLLWTGMRCGELVGLTVESFALGDRPRVRVFGKGRKERDIPLPAPLLPWVAAYLAQHPTGHGRLLVDPTGRPLNADQVRRGLRRVMALAGLTYTGITPHGLRHTYATRLVNAGISILEVQKLLGHSSVATTQIYAHALLSPATLGALDLM